MDPAGASVHTVCPVEVEYFPDGQFIPAVPPVCGKYCPAGTAVQEAAPPVL